MRRTRASTCRSRSARACTWATRCRCTSADRDNAYAGKVRMIRSEPDFTPYYALIGEDAARLSYLAEVIAGRGRGRAAGRLAGAGRVRRGAADEAARPCRNDCAIRARGLTRRFGELVAVDHVDLEVPRRQVYGFLGPERFGQVHHHPHAVRPAHAERGRDRGARPAHSRTRPRRCARRIGYMTQKFSLFEDLHRAREPGVPGRGAGRAAARARGNASTNWSSSTTSAIGRSSWPAP